MSKVDLHKKAMIDALVKSLGVVTTACREVGISRTLHYNWMSDDPDYKKAVEDISDVALDFAETMLHKNIQERDTTSIIFYLKTKGKRRGYIERQEIDANVTEIADIVRSKYPFARADESE